ncbi:MAG: AAA family ATPase [Acidimicrobiales bacterium]
MSGSLFIVTGPPGAGKSTVASLLAADSDRSVLVEGDAFFGFLASGFIEPWLAASHSQNEIVTEAAAAATGRFVYGGYSTVYDGVLGPWLLDHFLGLFPIDDPSLSIDYAILLPSVERCIERVRAREGHGFSDEAATAHMHQQFSTAAIDARHVFDNGDEQPGTTAERLLAAAADRALRYRR